MLGCSRKNNCKFKSINFINLPKAVVKHKLKEVVITPLVQPSIFDEVAGWHRLEDMYRISCLYLFQLFSYPYLSLSALINLLDSFGIVYY